jgi:hypothetical protein
MRKKFNLSDREKLLERVSLREFFVWWDDIPTSVVTSLRKCLKNARREQDIQNFLEANPSLLILHLSAGHGRWVIPHQRLGAEHVTDFLIAEKDSAGFYWTAVELESPKSSPFLKNGDPSAALNHAIRQILDWRSWLGKNQDYAARCKSRHGLGLEDIRSSIPGLILIGRRNMLNDSVNERRKQLESELKIRIHTFDWLLDIADLHSAAPTQK